MSKKSLKEAAFSSPQKPSKSTTLAGTTRSDVMQKKIFASNLKMHMGDRSQKEIADRLGVSTQVFNNWYKGKALPKVSMIQKIADFFRVPMSALVDPVLSYPESVKVRDEGEDIKRAYLDADDVTKEMVRRILKIDE